MKTIGELQSALKTSFPAAKLTIDKPTEGDGSYFIDIRLGTRHAIVEWVGGSSFGFSQGPLSDADFGGGPSEVFTNFDELRRRLGESLRQDERLAQGAG
jgi:hypothetical protein